jgi:integrase
MAKRRSKKDHHLFLKGGVWWTRFACAGRDERASTKCPKSEIGAARLIRDQRLGEIATRRAGLEPLREPLLLGELIEAYLAEESGFFDREKDGEQPGTKRSAETDRSSKKRVLRHLEASISSAAVDPEMLLGLAESMERETPTPAKATRKKTMAFLRRVYSWAAERPTRTGIRVSPFALVTRPQRKRLLPRGGKRAYIYSPEQLRALYEFLPAHSARVTRFAVHTGMRLREIFRLRWGVVDLDAGKLTVLAKYAKSGKDREVALGDVARSILEAVRPAEPGSEAAVFLGETGEPLKTIYTGFVAAVEKVWKPEKPGQARPRFHDLRKTGATRIEAVSSHAVAKAFLGHEDSDVTDSYIRAPIENVRAAINRAARSIDGETPAGAIPFPVKGIEADMAHQMAPQAISAGSEQ